MPQDFPATPADNDIFGDFIYKAVDDAWRKKEPAYGGLPCGAIIPWAGATAPANWLLCDGAAVSRTTYASLFGLVSTTYGAGDGSTTFNVPDLRGRIPVGKNGGSFGTLGATGGVESVALTEAQMPSHTHIQNAHNHTHRQWIFNGAGHSGGNRYGFGYAGNTGAANDSGAASSSGEVQYGNYPATATNQNAGGGQAHTNLQPYQVVNYIIKTTIAETQGDSELAPRLSALEASISSHNDVTVTSPNVGDTLVWNGTEFVNSGLNEPIWYDLVLTSPGWTSYNEHVIYDDFCAPAYTKIGGIVSLQGMLQSGSTYSANTVIATLPPGYRPDTNMIFVAAENSTAKNVRVLSNGNIILGSGFAGQWVSLDNVVFPAAGVASWTEVNTFENGWSDYGDSLYGKARYWKDQYGVVWFAGLIRPGTYGNRAFSLPASHQSDKVQHHLVANNEGVCALRVRSDVGGVDVYNGSGVWVSLAGVVGYTAECRNLLSWEYPRAQNGANWGTLYPNVGYAQRPDGLVHLQGLHNPTNGTKVFILPRSARKEQKQLRAQIGGDVFCRLDIFGMNEMSNATMGGLNWVSGSSWRSFDGITYAPTPRSFRPKYM